MRLTPTSRGPERLPHAEALFLAAALISFVLSVVLWFADNQIEAVFVGLWVPSILSFGAFYFARFRGR